MFLPLLAFLAVDAAAYGVMQARTTCKPLEASESMTYHYSQGTVSGQYGKQEYDEGVKVTVSCKDNSQELLGEFLLGISELVI
ncbi:unnamed protein product [Heligmosomoides polygyrus]|uniref:SCPU domain-containing protein n=1 Tax=Heligmosomoides polygyrus TaxID=6339 RepID=A0A183F1T9_HELPZ|nr:unnamed protein product [Heligmosomoides polygyrus]